MGLNDISHSTALKHTDLRWEILYRVIDEALIAETAVWPNIFLMNIFFALKGSNFSLLIVRVSFLRRQFQRQYDERWSHDLFVVTERFMKGGIPQYRLKDYDGEIITGTFYENQLNRAFEQEVYFIEKILKIRNKAGKKEYLVRWKVWAPKYDSWVS